MPNFVTIDEQEIKEAGYAIEERDWYYAIVDSKGKTVLDIIIPEKNQNIVIVLNQGGFFYSNKVYIFLFNNKTVVAIG